HLTSPADGASVHTRAEVVADVPGDGLNSVSFAVQVGDGPWKRLGTASRAPYRVFQDLDGLAAGTKLTYKAVVRDSAGRTASALSHATVGTPPVAGESEYLVAHYQRPAGDYGPSSLSTWGA